MLKRFNPPARFLPRRLRLYLEALEDRWLPSSGSYGQLPLSFVPNQGQAAAAVDFTSSGSGYAVTLSRGQATLALQGTAAGVATLDMRLVGVNPSPQVTGLRQLPGTANYLIGNDPRQWHTNVPTYGEIEYQDVYPGVNLTYHGSNQQQLEYDFVISPGAHPGTIRLNIAGAQAMSLDAQGNLVLQVDGSTVVEKAPLAYQTISGATRSVAVRYVLQNDHQVGFAVGPYDASQAVTIDPVLSYSTYLGGSVQDAAQAISVDRAGNAYVTGYTLSSDFPVINPIQKTSQGIFVAKLNATGSALLYSTYLSQGASEIGKGIAVDAAGDAFVTGVTEATDFPTAGTPFQSTLQGLQDAFVAELNPSGDGLIYSTYLGGTGGSTTSSGIALDSSGDAYVAGWTYSSAFPTANAAEPTFLGSGGSSDGFVTKLNPQGSALLFSTFVGGSGLSIGGGGRSGDAVFALALDPSGNAYVTGTVSSTDFPTVNPFQARPAGFEDAFVTKVSADGSAFLYSSYLGGAPSAAGGGNQGYGIAADANGEAYVVGFTSTTDFPTVNALQPTSRGPSDAFVTKVSPQGNSLVFSTYLGGTGTESAEGVALDSAGNAYITGLTSSSDFPTVNPLTGISSGMVFVSELKSDGSALIESTYLTNGLVGGIALDSAANIYVAGTPESTDFPTTSNAFQPQASTSNGDNAFVTKIANYTWQGTDVSVSTSGKAQILWSSSDGVLTLWTIDSSTTPFSVNTFPAHVMGSGWYAVAEASGGSDGLNWILWHRTDGGTELSGFNAQGQIQAANQLNPPPGYRPIDIAVGSDGNLRVLWSNLSGQALISDTDPTQNTTSSVVYGPFPGATPVRIAGGSDGLTRLLWDNVGGGATLWLLNSDGTVNATHTLGSVPGWTVDDIAGGSDNKARILWTNASGQAIIWTVDNSFNKSFGPVVGPVTGWTAAELDSAQDGTLRLLWYNLSGKVALWALAGDGSFESAGAWGPY
jgi:hypothetical protein